MSKIQFGLSEREDPAITVLRVLRLVTGDGFFWGFVIGAQDHERPADRTVSNFKSGDTR